MNCDELRDHYELYALGIAEDPEPAKSARTSNQDCPICVPGVRNARQLINLIGATCAGGRAARPAA